MSDALKFVFSPLLYYVIHVKRDLKSIRLCGVLSLGCAMRRYPFLFHLVATTILETILLAGEGQTCMLMILALP